MELRKVNPIIVSGFSVRTNNASEINPTTAQIGKLWERFYSAHSAQINQTTLCYGVYYNYESDASGDFSVMAASDGLEKSSSQNLEKLEICGGDYLVFTGKGAMPQTIINVWKDIWSYFSGPVDFVRLYKTDFELYKNSNEVEVYIGVKSA